MVVVQVYSKNKKLNYKTTLLSKGTFVHIFFGLFSIVLPYIFAYNSGGLWRKEAVFYEQPSVLFKGDYIFVATTTNSSHPIVCSTFPFYKQLNNRHSCTEAKAREIDNNYDGKADKFTFSLIFNIPRATKVQSINLIIPIDYRLKTVCLLHMESAIIFQENCVNPAATKVALLADLALFQTTSISCNKRHVNTEYNTPIIANNGPSSYELENIYSNYINRNLTTHLSNMFTTSKLEDLNKFSINITVRYPQVSVHYRTGFWKVMKWAWIQYFASYVVIAWIIGKVKAYIFDNNLVLFYVEGKTKMD